MKLRTQGFLRESNSTAVNPLKADPTRTGSLQRAFIKDIEAGYKRLRRAVVHLIQTQDTLGLRPLVVNADWAGETNPRKVERFRSWLRGQMGSDLAGDELIQKYIEQSYRKGVNRAYVDANRKERAGAVTETAKSFQDGAQRQFLKTTFSQEATVEKVKLLAGRTFSELEDVNSRMATKMSRVLVDGLVTGKSPDEIAKVMVDEVDIEENRACMICRTEIVRAHAEGQLDALDAEGVEEIGVDVEWDIARGGNVCPKCASMGGKVFTVDEARGLIPMHPNCRCAWVPYAQKTKDGLDTRDTIRPGKTRKVTLPDGTAVEWEAAPNRPPKRYTTVLVDPAKLDRDWSKEGRDFYIPPGGGGGEIEGRIEGFKAFMRKGEPIEASEVAMTPGGVPFFGNGRHRFATMRDLGAPAVAITVPKKEAKLFVARYGINAPQAPGVK